MHASIVRLYPIVRSAAGACLSLAARCGARTDVRCTPATTGRSFFTRNAILRLIPPLLAISLGAATTTRLAAQSLSAFSGVAPFFGVYFGTFEEGRGRWAMTVSWQGLGVFDFIGRPAEGAPLIRSYLYAVDFNYNGTFEGSTIDGRTIVGRVTEGKIVAGRVTGGALNYDFVGDVDRDGGASAAFAGLWTWSKGILASPLTVENPLIEVIVGPSGKALVAMRTSLTDGEDGMTRVDQNGEFVATLSGGTRVSGRIDVGARQLRIALAPDQLPPAPAGRAQIVNFSTLSTVDTSGAAALQRFSIVGAGKSDKPLLLRTVGTSLSRVLGTDNALDSVGVELWRDRGLIVATIDGWDSDDPALARATREVGALPLSPAGKDAARIVNLASGNYGSFVRSAPAGPSAAVLAEIFDLDPGNGRLTHVSTRGRVEPGRDDLVSGFVIAGDKPALILVRAIGPKLAAFGVTDPLADPQLQISTSRGTSVAQNDNWSPLDPPLVSALQRAGGMRYDFGSKDAALLVALPPGAYTASVRGANGTRGTAQIEIAEADMLPANAEPLGVELFTVLRGRTAPAYYDYEPRIVVTGTSAATGVTVTKLTFSWPQADRDSSAVWQPRKNVPPGGSVELIPILYGEPEFSFSGSFNVDHVTVVVTFLDSEQRERSITATTQVISKGN